MLSILQTRIGFTLKNSNHKKLEQFNRASFMLALPLILFFGINFGLAQDDNEDKDRYKPFNTGGHLKNMHIWHGFVVHPGAMFATHLEYNSKNEKFTLGVWGGAGFTTTDVIHKDSGQNVRANYKEVSIYALYRLSDRFFAEAVSHNNYTGVEERGDKLNYWSYDKTQGYNFVDINFGYNVTPNTLLYLATIIGGGSGDYEIQPDGSLKNSWTHYFEVKARCGKLTITNYPYLPVVHGPS
ncbi:hypothetical protein ZORO111902_06415 [Zobellia roscoffensis]